MQSETRKRHYGGGYSALWAERVNLFGVCGIMSEAEYKFVYGLIGWSRRPSNWRELPMPGYKQDPLTYDRDRSINNKGKGTYCPELNQWCFSKADAIAKGKAKKCTYIS